jgi:hypothetical protein
LSAGVAKVKVMAWHTWAHDGSSARASPFSSKR